MPDTLSWQLAMRAQAETLQVATTGAVSLSATATGYARASGSFLADGLVPGLEVLAAGFGTGANNGSRTILAVTSGTVTVLGGCTAEIAGAGRSLTVGLPALRAWENIALTPVQGRPHVEEQFIPGPGNLVTLGTFGQMLYEPMYQLALYGIANAGLGAVVKYADAILALFPPKLALTLTGGDILRVRGDVAPFRGQMIFRQDLPGHAVVPVTIPFRVETFNTL
jgi:hypothetical protein